MTEVAGLEDLPAAAGAYALLLRLGEPLDLRGALLMPGDYVYAGSAYGPGGIRARVARHARSDKASHWHIDRLTPAAALAGVLALPGGRECDVIARIEREPRSNVPIAGFGSSDCRVCAAHLLGVPAGFDLAAYFAEHGDWVLWRPALLAPTRGRA